MLPGFQSDAFQQDAFQNDAGTATGAGFQCDAFQQDAFQNDCANDNAGFECDAFQQDAFQNDCATVVVVTKGYPPKHRKKKRAERPVEYRSSKREKEWQALLDEQFGKKADIRKELLDAIDGKPEPEVKAPELANSVVSEAAPIILSAPIFDPVRIIPEAPAIDPDEEALMILLLAA